MFKRLVGLLFFVCSMTVIMAETTVSITDVSIQQRWPWNNLVDIKYTVSVEPADPEADIHIFVTGIDKNSNQGVFMKSLTGDGVPGTTVKPGTYSMIWDAGKDHPNFNTSKFSVKMSAIIGEALYYVVDLSEGSEATSYPISTLASLPDPIPDEYKTTKLVLRYIPAGAFMMGSPSGELGRNSSNETQHMVTLTKPFYMGVFEVTQKQWDLVMGSNSSSYKGDMRPVEQVKHDDIRGSSEGRGWPSHNRVDTTSFLGKLRIKTGIEFDLPTEAQWEYACRAGTTRAYNDYTKNNGEGSDCLTGSSTADTNLDSLAWYKSNTANVGHKTVGTKQANAWGLYDMHGNVYEWCLDQYTASLGVEAVVDPTGANVSSGTFRVFRGGYWSFYAYYCRSASRGYHNPDYARNYIGFRLCSAPPVQ